MYIPEKINITKNEYAQARILIRSLPELKEKRAKLMQASPPPPDGMPRGKGGTGDPTGDKASRIAEISERIKLIESCMETIPEEYRAGVKYYLTHRDVTRKRTITVFRLYCNPDTFTRYVNAYVEEVARRAGIVI